MAIEMQGVARAEVRPVQGAVLGMKVQGLGRHLGDSKSHLYNMIWSDRGTEMETVSGIFYSTKHCSRHNWAYPVKIPPHISSRVINALR
jgi:hypothetical protein